MVHPLTCEQSTMASLYRQAPIYSESLPPLIVGSTFRAEEEKKKVGQGKVMFEVIHSRGPLLWSLDDIG